MREVSLTYGAMLSGDAETYFGLWVRQPKAKEAFMRVITVAVIMIAVIAVGGFTLRHMHSL
jgi:hypothetical protein